MLAIERLPGASVMIGENIRIQVLSVRKGARVKLGIDAPRSIDINREELLEQLSPATAPPAPACETPRPRVVAAGCDTTTVDRALCSAGAATVSHCANGADLLAAIETDGAPDLILLALRLDDMSGLTVLRTLRSTRAGRTAPVVIMINEETSDGALMRCLDAGACAFVRADRGDDALRASLARITEFWLRRDAA